MWKYPSESELFVKFGKYAKITGVIFFILGLAGIFAPVFMTMITVAFVAWLMLFAGIFAGYFTWLSDRSSWIGWFKSFVLVFVSLFMIFSPLGGAATLGMLLAVYFFTDSFSSFAMTSMQYPNKTWWIWLINGLLSFALGIVLVVGWPFSSLYLVGLFIGVSLFFDGIALFFTGSFLNKIGK
ncbi:MAG: DUF308 domain-containing protein [Sulfurovaceae bacterium]|nr:DUF308 domain-containing protein [Sulfurovaceae bacterium]